MCGFEVHLVMKIAEDEEWTLLFSGREQGGCNLVGRWVFEHVGRCLAKSNSNATTSMPCVRGKCLQECLRCKGGAASSKTGGS